MKLKRNLLLRLPRQFLTFILISVISERSLLSSSTTFLAVFLSESISEVRVDSVWEESFWRVESSFFRRVISFLGEVCFSLDFRPKRSRGGEGEVSI